MQSQTATPAKKKQGFFSSIFSKSNPDLTQANPQSQIPLPYDLVQIRQAAYSQRATHRMPSKSPWQKQQLFNTVVLPSFNGLSQTVPICIVAPSTTEIAISISAPANSGLGKVCGVLLSDQNPAQMWQEVQEFCFQKGADASTFMLKTDIRAGTYRFLAYSSDFKRPVVTRDTEKEKKHSDVLEMNVLICSIKFLTTNRKIEFIEIPTLVYYPFVLAYLPTENFYQTRLKQRL